MASAVHLMAMQYTQVGLLNYTSVLFLMLDDGLCSTLDEKCSTPKWGSWIHPSVVPDARRWQMQYTWWQMQYTKVRLLKCIPVLFLMLDDGLYITLVGNCSTPKRGSWSAPQCCSCRWWPLQYTLWQMQYTQMKLLMYMIAYSVHLLAYTVHHVRLLIYMIGYAVHLMADTVHPSEAPEMHPSDFLDVRWWFLQYTQVRLLKYIPVLLLMLEDGFCSTLDGKCSAPVGKCSTPKWGSWCTWWTL